MTKPAFAAVLWLPRELFRRPLIGFLLLGGLLYVADVAGLASPDESSLVVIESQQVERLRQQWTEKLGRAPTDDEMSAVLEKIAVDEMLIAEAIERGWHRSDQVVLRRLKQNLAFLGMATDREGLERAYDLDFHRRDPVVRKRLRLLMESELLAGTPMVDFDEQAVVPDPVLKLSFDHIFRKDPIKADELAALKKVNPRYAASESDPFLESHHFEKVTRATIARKFGPTFAKAVGVSTTGQWVGPVDSAFGDHLVYLSSREFVVPEVDERKTALSRRLESEKDRLRAAMAELRAQYQWRVETQRGTDE